MCLPFSSGILLFLNSPVSSESLRFSASFFFSSSAVFSKLSQTMLFLSWPRTPCASSTLLVILSWTVSLLSVGHWWTAATGVPWDAALSCHSLQGAQGRGMGKQYRKNPQIHVKSCLHVPHKDQAWQFSLLWGEYFSSQLHQIVNSWFVFQHLLTDESKAKRRNRVLSAKQEMWLYFKSLALIIFRSLIYVYVLEAWYFKSAITE